MKNLKKKRESKKVTNESGTKRQRLEQQTEEVLEKGSTIFKSLFCMDKAEADDIDHHHGDFMVRCAKMGLQ